MSGKQLAVLNDKAIGSLNDVLKDLIDSGEVKVSELNPSLNSLLTDPVNGGFPGRVFAGEVVGYRVGVLMSSFGDEDVKDPVDVLELKDATGAFLNQTFNFYARNGGQKAKVAGVDGKKFVVIAFKGEVESENRSYNPWKDYLIMGVDRKEVALQATAKIETAVGRKAVEPVKVGAGASK